MKIVVADKISERGMDVFRAEGWHVSTPSPEAPAADLKDASALIVRSTTRVTAELLERAEKLKVVGRAGVGVDNVDVEAATRRGVLVMNTPGGNAVSVAEHTIGLLLALARSIPQANASVHAGRWEKSGFGGVEVREKTLGLIGLGRVGLEVARRAAAFEMKLVAYDPYVAKPVAEDAGVELVTLQELLAKSDFVSLHATLSPATEKMLDRKTLERVKLGARIINTSRGELIDEAALVEAIQSGRVAGAALDVFAEEPPRTSPLLGLPQVIATPHIAGSTEEAQEEVGYRIATQVRDFLKEGVIRNAVNLPTLSAEEYRRVEPYLELGQHLGAFVAQIATGGPHSVCLRYAGEPSEIHTQLIRNAVLLGLLNAILSEKANLVNATALATERGIQVEERRTTRTTGFPNTVEVTLRTDLPSGEKAGKPASPAIGGASGATVAQREFVVEGTVLPARTGAGLRAGMPGASLRILAIDGIDIEAPLEGTLLFIRNRDVPGVIGQIGTILGSRNINIATFALGRRESPAAGSSGDRTAGPADGGAGADALAVIRVDGPVPDSALVAIRGVPAVTEAHVVEL